ncbi:MAG: tripartite tricarboxylate transporter substrate binding protein [Burkholderiales bacterium]|nr:tripartite tricarboxylate transporter substrate binding protein [Burkholderiales bacterium]
MKFSDFLFPASMDRARDHGEIHVFPRDGRGTSFTADRTGRARACVLAGLAAAALAAAQGAGAQGYPSRTVRLVVPWAAGGSTDSIGRILAQKLTEYTGQQWIVDNRGGATGTIGHAFAAKAAPDGYTLLLGTNSTFAIAPHLYRNLQYDNDRAFAPVSLVAISPQILSVHPSLPVRSVKELVALARARPGAIPFSTAGVGATSHMATELLMNMAGIRMTHVPYKGGGPSAQALISGETALSFVDVITASPQAQAGRLRPIATSTAARTPLMPELPTIAESGLPGFESVTSFGLFAPAGTAQEIVSRVNREVARALGAADVRDRLRAQGIDPAGTAPGELVAHQKRETEKWGKVIREQGIRFE